MESRAVGSGEIQDLVWKHPCHLSPHSVAVERTAYEEDRVGMGRTPNGETVMAPVETSFYLRDVTDGDRGRPQRVFKSPLLNQKLVLKRSVGHSHFCTTKVNNEF